MQKENCLTRVSCASRINIFNDLMMLEESMKTINLIWALSLVVLGICTFILAGANLLSLGLSDIITRGIGLLDLVALPILGYTTIKKLKDKHGSM